jgi:hypothetical protein
MLRIIRIAEDDSVETLKLEGKLLGPWVDELREAYALATTRSRRTQLDLAALTFVDADGAEVLRDLIRGGAEIAACSSYVAALLQMEG